MRTTVGLVILLALAISSKVSAQGSWDLGGNYITTLNTDWLGADANSTIPLQIRHDGTRSIDFSTTLDRRWSLMPSGTYTIGSFPGMATGGFAIMSPDVDAFYANGGPGPYSLLHLAAESDNTQQLSYRPWMRIGISMTGNADHSYIGQKAKSTLDYTDLIINWSDNPGKWLKDRCRFLFTSEYDPLASFGATSFEGLEALRLYPVDNFNVNVGIGDWFAANFNDPTIIEPEERLDIVDGRVRIRALPTSNPQPALTKLMVVDNDGVVHWKPESLDCEWSMNTASNNYLFTAFGPPSTTCPDDQDMVAIGMDMTPPAFASSKFLVRNNKFQTGGTIENINPTYLTDIYGVKIQVTGNLGISGSMGHTALYAVAEGPTEYSFGISAKTDGGSIWGRAGSFESHDDAIGTEGVRGIAWRGRTSSTGVYGEVFSQASSTNRGVAGRAFATTSSGWQYVGVFGHAELNSDNQVAYGVHGVAYPLRNSWAGYFDGNLNTTGTGYFVNGTFVASDAGFKSNVEDLEDPMELISQLEPRQYQYLADEYEHLNFPSGVQVGFIAQELEEVIPQLVRLSTISATYDTLGNELIPAIEYKAVNYAGLVPYLTGAVKQQQATIDSQQAQIAALTEQATANAVAADELQELRDRMDLLEQLLALCCQNPDGERNMIDDGTGSLNPTDDRNLRIEPNPFNEQTTIYYKLERGGRMQLMVNSSDGKHLRVLEEAQMPAGEYQYAWFTADMSAGIYYVTLLLDGEPVVKKAVKVN